MSKAKLSVLICFDAPAGCISDAGSVALLLDKKGQFWLDLHHVCRKCIIILTAM